MFSCKVLAFVGKRNAIEPFYSSSLKSESIAVALIKATWVGTLNLVTCSCLIMIIGWKLWRGKTWIPSEIYVGILNLKYSQYQNNNTCQFMMLIMRWNPSIWAIPIHFTWFLRIWKSGRVLVFDTNIYGCKLSSDTCPKTSMIF